MMAIKEATAVAARTDTEVPGTIRRDQYGRPLITGPDGTTRPYTRASSFGGALEDAFGVNRWKLGRIALGMGRRPDLVARASAVPLPCGASDDRHKCKPPCADSKDGKRELAEIQDAAMAASGADAKANLGTALHAITEGLDHGGEVDESGPYAPILTRYRGLMAPYRVRMTEVFVVCERWGGIAGTFDKLISPTGYLVAPDGEVFSEDSGIVVDTKTSGSARYFGAKFVCQTKPYSAGEPVDKETGRVVGWGEHPRPSQTWALILHLPSHVDLIDDAGWYWVDLKRGEALCDLAAQVRAVQKEKGLIVPAVRGVTAQHPADLRRAGALSKIDKALSVAALKMVRRSHAAVWDDELQAIAQAKADEIRGAGEGVAS